MIDIIILSVFYVVMVTAGLFCMKKQDTESIKEPLLP